MKTFQMLFGLVLANLVRWVSVVIVTGFFMLCGFATLLGQNLIQPLPGENRLEIMELENRIAVTGYQQVEVNLSLLKEERQLFRVAFFDREVDLRQTRLSIRRMGDFSWFGSGSDGMSSVVLTVMDDDVQGIITHFTEIYRIETIDGRYFVTRIDQAKYPTESCSHLAEVELDVLPHHHSQHREEHNSSTSTARISGEPFTCRVRLLVMYTSAAEAAAPNIHNTIRLAVDEMTQSFMNSNVPMEVELVYVGETDYEESGVFEDDVNNFQENGDGQMDEVHDFRTIHQADICVLITDDDTSCGFASVIKASTPSAFCAVYWDCATGNFSFAHEVGHLVGCQHHEDDPTSEDATNEWPFAHGFKSPDDDWRTIMAYDCPDEDGCPRLLFWSNPDVNWGAPNNPMGIAETNDNARMLEEKFPNVMSYLQPINDVIVENGDIANSLEGDIIAVERVTTNGEVVVGNGQPYSFRAGNSIVLNPGFVAESGSDFVAEIVDVSNCGQPDGEPSDFTRVDMNGLTENGLVPETVKVFPNPAQSSLTVSFHSDEQDDVRMVVYDFIGNEIQKTPSIKGVNGVFQRELDVANLPGGTYFITILTNGGDVLGSHRFTKT